MFINVIIELISNSWGMWKIIECVFSELFNGDKWMRKVEKELVSYRSLFFIKFFMIYWKNNCNGYFFIFV